MDRTQRELLGWLRATRAPLPAPDPLVGAPARHPGIARAIAELRRFGVPTRLAFVWSASGSGVEDDAPRTIHIHRALLAADRAPAAVLALSERTAALDLASVARHEIGHALVFLDGRVTRTAGFRRLFGDVTRRYRVGTAADEVERRLTRNGGFANPRYRRVVSLYAATHPHERFAEAVKMALASGGRVAAARAWTDRHGLDPIVVDQIQLAADWLRAYRKR